MFLLLTRAAAVKPIACVWNTNEPTFIGTETALMKQGGRSQQRAVFTAIWANGPVYTTQGSSVNRGRRRAALRNRGGRSVRFTVLFLHLALTRGA